MKQLKVIGLVGAPFVLILLVALLTTTTTDFQAQADHNSHSLGQTGAVPNFVTPTDNGVNIMNFAFSPATITVTLGSTVTWTNLDAATHTVSSDVGSADVFDSGNLTNSQTFSHTFNSPGTFNYHCNIHAFMMAQVVVVPPPPPVISGFSPPSGTPNPGGAAFDLSIAGTGFVSGATVSWNGSPRATTFISTTQVVAVVQASDIVTPSLTASIVVTNPGNNASSGSNYAVAGSCTALLVSKTVDDNSCGTLKNAVGVNTGGAPKTINFMPLHNPIILSGGYTLDNTILNGICTATVRGIALDGTGQAGDGLTITNGQLKGIKVHGFGGRQIVVGPGGNQLSCVQASKT